MIFTPELFPFYVALMVLIAIGIIEGVGLLLGAAFSSFIDTVLPDFDIDLDVEADVSAHGALTKILGWLNFGRVPALVIFICFLAAFAISGFFIQGLTHSITGGYLPSLVSIPVSLMGAIPFTRVFTNFMSRIMPSDETSAVPTDSFIGMVAVITIGESKQGLPAEAKLEDKHGQIHYVMVEPKTAEVTFKQGESVLLAKLKSDVGFYAIKNTNTNLID